MKVLCKILAVCSLLVSAQAFAAVEPARSSKADILQSLFYDALTGRLQEPHAEELGNVQDCAALYSVDNIEIMIRAGYKIHHCNNVNERAIKGHFNGQRELFEAEMIACAVLESQRDTLSCYADAVLNLFSQGNAQVARQDYRRRKACIFREVTEAVVKLNEATTELENCLSQQPPQNSTVLPSQNTTSGEPGWNTTHWPNTNTTPNFTTIATTPFPPCNTTWYPTNSTEGPWGGNTTANPWWPTNSTADPWWPTNSTANPWWPTNSTADPWRPTNSTANPWWPTNSTADPWWPTNSTELPWGGNSTYNPWFPANQTVGGNTTYNPWFPTNSTAGPWTGNSTYNPWWPTNSTQVPSYNSTQGPWLGNSTTEAPRWNTTTPSWNYTTVAVSTTTETGNWFNHLLHELGDLF
ncbi:hypothetical protein KR038_011979 [Drosophila bunnanda]|nr:hypothetical protein KR038_011979 [Drosophila bunnanda]